MKVFISHASSDKPLARQAAEVLAEAGLDVWWDGDVLPGDNWANEHAKALESSQAMVVLLSPVSMKSRHVRSDVSFALGQPFYKDRVVPVAVSAYDITENSEVPWVLKRMDAVKLDAFNRPEDAFREVADRLKRSLETASD